MPDKKVLRVMMAMLAAVMFSVVMSVQADIKDHPIVINGDFEGGGEGDPYIPDGWQDGHGEQAFQTGELTLNTENPLSGKASLEINTLDRGSVKRKLYLPLAVDVAPLHEISFKGKHLGGEYVSISVRNRVDSGDTTFLQAIGNVNILNALHGDSQEYRGTYYNDIARPYLVIQTHGPVHVMIDDIGIKPLAGHGRQWDTWRDQRLAWDGEWHELTAEIETPHTKWVKPYSGGEMRVMTLMPRWRQRWTVELAQRMSVAYDPVIFADPNTLGNDYWVLDDDGDPTIFRVKDDAMGKLAEPADCLVIGYLSPSAIPGEMVEAVLEKVSGGAGLVILGYDQPFWPRPDGMEPLDKFREGPWARALNDENRTEADPGYVALGPVMGQEEEFYEFGKGRIALLRQTPVPGTGEFMRAEFEAQIAYISKAMLWASGRLPSSRLENVELPGEKTGVLRGMIDRAELPATVRLTFSEPLAEDGRLVWWFDDYNGQSIDEHSTAVAADQTEEGIELPKLAGGVHWLHMQLKTSTDTVVDWTTAVLEVTAEPGIETIEFSEGALPYYQVGDTIDGRATFNAPVGQEYLLRLRLADADGHLWQEREFSADGSREISFSIPIDAAPVLMHQLQAELIGPDGVTDRKTYELAIIRENEWYQNAFGYQIWQIPWCGCYAWNYLGHLVCGELRNVHGVTISYRGSARINAYNNIRSMGPTGGNTPAPNAELAGDKIHAPERSPCLSSPGYRRQIEAQIKNTDLPNALRYAPIGYEMGHEVNLLGFGRIEGKADVDICFSSDCLASFRNFLREEYGELSVLNASWGTDFEDWDKVTPAVLADALENDQISRWIDHRRHMDRVFADFWRHKIEVVRRHDPQAIGIADNARDPTSYSGVDYWLLLNEVVSGSHFPVQYMRSFVPEDRKHLTWARAAYWHPMIISPDTDMYRRRFGDLAWINLFQDMRGFAYYAEVFYGRPNDFGYMPQPILMDLRSTETGRWGYEPVAHIRTGIDRVIFESRREDSGIAVLYSRSSEHAAVAWQALQGGGLAEKMHPASQFSLFARSLELLDFQYNAISEAQISAGNLQTKNVKLLILPFAQALDAETASKIEEFVAAGGVVLADIRPGVSDRHGRVNNSGLLDELFGVRHDSAWKAYTPVEDVLNLDGEIEGIDLSVSRLPVILGPKVELTQATALDNSAHQTTVIVNQHGSGSAILLNFTPLDSGSETLDLLGTLFEHYGLKPIFGIETLEVRRPPENEPVKRETPVALTTPEGEPADAEGYMAVGAVGEPERPTLASYTNGNIVSFAFWYFYRDSRRGPGEELLRITPPREGHIYDLIRNDYIGRHSRFDIVTPLEGFRAFSVLPYRIEPPELSLRASRTEAGHPRLECRVRALPESAANERHVVRLRLFAPDGEEWSDFAATVVTENGTADHEFLLPLNAPKGVWRVQAREAISGLEDERIAKW